MLDLLGDAEERVPAALVIEPPLALPMALAMAAGIVLALAAQRRMAFLSLAFALIIALLSFALAAAAGMQSLAASVGFAGAGAACGLAGPLAFGRTPVGVAASLVAAVFAYWCGLWALFALSCAGAGAECV